MLTALGEDSLLQFERRQVLAHISCCAECRETLSVAAAAALDSTEDLEPLVATRVPTRRPRIWLPWASAAAGILVVCLAVAFYQQRTALQKNTEAANREPVQIPSSSIQPTPPAVDRKEAFARATNSPAKKQLQATLGLQSAAAGGEIAKDKIELAKKFDLNQQDSYKPSAAVSELEAPSAPTMKAAQPAPAAAFANTITERAMSAGSSIAAARPHWRINSIGQAERAFGEGVWQAVLPQEQAKMRVISVFEHGVWIGGENSRLYRSTDNGATWRLVALPEKDGREHSIAHIHFQTAESGTVESDDGTEWTTSDGGNSWK